MSFYDKSDNDVEISSVDRFSDKEWFRSTIFIAILTTFRKYTYTFRGVFEAKHVRKRCMSRNNFHLVEISVVETWWWARSQGEARQTERKD